MPTFRSLGGPFNRLWLASTISNIGDGVRFTALPLLALQVTDDARLIAGVVVAERLPWVALILPGGVLADRYDRRRLRVVLDTARGIVMALLTIMVLTDVASIAVIIAAAALLASAESIVDSASMTMVPALVDSNDLERAGGVMQSTELIAGALIGPPLGGLLFAASLSVPFGVDAATFLVAAVVAATIPGNFRPSGSAHDAGERQSFTADIGTGFRWLWSQRVLRNLALLSMVLGFAGLMYGAILALFASEVLGLGPVGFGLLLVPAAIGGVCGSLLANRLTVYPLDRVLAVAVTGSALSLLGIAATSNPWVVGGLIALEAASILVWNVLTVALRQRVIPDELLGRVSAAYRFVVYAAMPVGAAIGGVVAEATSLPTVFVIAGVLELMAALALPHLTRPENQRTRVDLAHDVRKIHTPSAGHGGQE